MPGSATPPDVSDDAPAAPIKERTDAIDKGGADARSYSWLRLQNNLRVLLISDPATDHAAVAMDVAVGSASDPEELPGLAHFCEHMLFLGTESFPKEDAYQSYLEQHGGFSNAMTTHENTTFYCDVLHPFLAGTLDRFAAFFKCPLFSPSAAEREVNAVDSENRDMLQSDPWRLQQLLKGAADPRHPWSRFNVGNLQTLRDRPAADGRPALEVRRALIEFQSRHYSANRMCAAVLGRQSLGELEELAVLHFGGVADKQLAPEAWPHPPYPAERLGKRYRIVPVKENHCVTVMWPLPCIRHQYTTKPFRYVSHVLGHESCGSLLSLLRQKGWADQLLAGETRSQSDFATFEVVIELTEAGDAHADEVVSLVFSTLRMITERPDEEKFHEEMRELGALSLRFLDTTEPQQAVLGLVNAMHLYAPQHLISAPYIFDSFDAAAVVELLGQLTPSRATIFHLSRRHEPVATMREPWYGTAYTVAPIEPALLEAWAGVSVHEGLHWPEPNPFVPTDFTLACDRDGPGGGGGGGGGSSGGGGSGTCRHHVAMADLDHMVKVGSSSFDEITDSGILLKTQAALHERLSNSSSRSPM